MRALMFAPLAALLLGCGGGGTMKSTPKGGLADTPSAGPCTAASCARECTGGNRGSCVRLGIFVGLIREAGYTKASQATLQAACDGRNQGACAGLVAIMCNPDVQAAVTESCNALRSPLVERACRAGYPTACELLDGDQDEALQRVLTAAEPACGKHDFIACFLAAVATARIDGVNAGAPKLQVAAGLAREACKTDAIGCAYASAIHRIGVGADPDPKLIAGFEKQACVVEPRLFSCGGGSAPSSAAPAQ